ncbi:eye-specific diacylglycerol kinase isoform X2 [Bacillus rossius redtenbacheri]|uniref:eye-specific diacylglycerol kinase isoform X2 n=1 Tax=Bacillus rossius redtenbacheri TaxID=93214 RepID=UPI002FDE7A31
MHRLFSRTRTPTGADMKTQSSLEVPKQVRSASIDEIQLEAKRRGGGEPGAAGAAQLRVPPQQGQRSKSFDSSGGEAAYLEVPQRRFQRRRSSSDKAGAGTGAAEVYCVHCACAEEFHRLRAAEAGAARARSPSYSDETSSSEEDCPQDPPPPCIRVTLTPDAAAASPRRRSITRQEAFLLPDPSGASLDSVSDLTSEGSEECALVVGDIFLQVPDLRRDRAASVDSCFAKLGGRTEQLEAAGLEVPQAALRSRSVDIVLPTDEQARYKALALAQPPYGPGRPDDAAPGEGHHRPVRCTPDWSDAAVSGDHLWVPTSASGDLCYVGEQDCAKHGPRMKCCACKIVAHAVCIGALHEKVRFQCKPTFRDVGVRQYREQTCIHHHWVHRRAQKGKCRQCGKSFQSKLSFTSKEIVALGCSWCKMAYHNKETCFNLQKIGEECSLGNHSDIIVPPSWIVKLPRQGSFKSSLRKSPKKKTATKKKSKEKTDRDPKTFVIKPIPTTTMKPVLVFINPRSGGNQGAKLLQKFQWLLNPRQVFDLTQGGPRMGLELFRKAPNLRVLACGGDGTVGWVLSVLDQICISPAPPVGVLPLGTGNDLARALGWGGGYTDEPISKILSNTAESEVTMLDRWQLKVARNPDAEPNEEGKDSLPLSVVNNYFSLGVDAHIALEFHEAREAHPEKFNSRLRNKMFYGQAGGKDLVRRKWKGLAELVTLECDGKDLTGKLKEHKVHAIVFLNIPSYGGGTHPWNRAGGTMEPATDDGFIEVVGLTTYQLPLLQAGGHGTCIAQCQSARIITTKTIPMQVDGEACKLTPSVISLDLLNKVPMLSKRKGTKRDLPQTALEQVTVSIDRITMSDYEQHHYDKELLKQGAVPLGVIEVSPVSDLEQVRKMINNLQEAATLSSDWCFVDSCTAERFFRVDRAQEHLHYVMDIGTDHLYVLDAEQALAQTPDDETATASPSTSLDQQPSDSVEERESAPPPLPSDETSQESDDKDLSCQVGDNVDGGDGGVEGLEGGIAGPVETSHLLEKTSDGILKAAKNGDLKMLKSLHSQGYSLLSIDATGQTALHHGARSGHKDIVKYLITCAPASILNMADNCKGQTALHLAAAHRRRSVCCMLVAAGASLLLTDREGSSAHRLALGAGDADLAAYLHSQEHFQLAVDDVETVV